MASLTIRNIDDSLNATLRISAAANQRAMEEEARQILKRFSAVGGIELSPVSRSLPRQSSIPSVE